MQAFPNAARLAPLVVFWKYASERRGRVVVAEDDRTAKAFFDYLLSRIPSGGGFRATAMASFGRLMEPGRSVTVVLRRRHSVGIVRPRLATGEPVGHEPFMLASRVGAEFRYAVLLPDITTALEYVEAQQLRVGPDFKWVGFGGETLGEASTRLFGRTLLEGELEDRLPTYLHTAKDQIYSWLPPYLQKTGEDESRAERESVPDPHA